MPNDARILGTEGFIQLPAPHQCPNRLTVSRYNPSGPGVNVVQTPIVGGGLKYEILEFHELIETGRLQISTKAPTGPWESLPMGHEVLPPQDQWPCDSC